MEPLLSPAVLSAANHSVPCRLATVDAHGRPSVSPKEIFAAIDAEHLVIANIASPASVRNIAAGAPVCVGRFSGAQGSLYGERPSGTLRKPLAERSGARRLA
jgi:predicted pyridoxine 5'-phosphate oxidase superfamily flavin-nucleotide-binding protein